MEVITLETPVLVLSQVFWSVPRRPLQTTSLLSTRWLRNTATTSSMLWKPRLRPIASLLKPKPWRRSSKRLVQTSCNQSPSTSSGRRSWSSSNNPKTEFRRTTNTKKKTVREKKTTSSMKKTLSSSRRRTRARMSFKFPLPSASVSCSRLMDHTAETLCRFSRPLCSQLLRLMDPSKSKSSCFSSSMIWLSSWDLISLDQHISLLPKRFAATQVPSTLRLDKLLFTVSAWWPNMVEWLSHRSLSYAWRALELLLNSQWTPLPRRRKASRLSTTTPKTTLWLL